MFTAGDPEVVLETSGIGADRDSGGMAINMIPRDGGNVLTGSATFSYSGPDLEMSNVNDDLLKRGLDPTRIGALKKFGDSGVGIGGPIRRDRLWFFAAAREGVAQQYADGVYWNKLMQPASLLYEPDTARGIANTNDYSKDVSFRSPGSDREAQDRRLELVPEQLQLRVHLMTTAPRHARSGRAAQVLPDYLPSVVWTYPATSNSSSTRACRCGAGPERRARKDSTTPVPHPGSVPQSDVWQRRDPHHSAPPVSATVRLSYLTGSHQFKTA